MREYLLSLGDNEAACLPMPYLTCSTIHAVRAMVKISAMVMIKSSMPGCLTIAIRVKSRKAVVMKARIVKATVTPTTALPGAWPTAMSRMLCRNRASEIGSVANAKGLGGRRGASTRSSHHARKRESVRHRYRKGRVLSSPVVQQALQASKPALHHFDFVGFLYRWFERAALPCRGRGRLSPIAG